MKRLINKAKMLIATKDFGLIFLDKRGEASIGQALAILISVVLGALLLAGLYALFQNQVIPILGQKIQDMFNYQG
jgi:hypothetical protein